MTDKVLDRDENENTDQVQRLKPNAVGIIGVHVHGGGHRRPDHRNGRQRPHRGRLRKWFARTGRLPLRHRGTDAVRHRLRHHGQAPHRHRCLLRLHRPRAGPDRRHGQRSVDHHGVRGFRGLADRDLLVLLPEPDEFSVRRPRALGRPCPADVGAELGTRLLRHQHHCQGPRCLPADRDLHAFARCARGVVPRRRPEWVCGRARRSTRVGTFSPPPESWGPAPDWGSSSRSGRGSGSSRRRCTARSRATPRRSSRAPPS